MPKTLGGILGFVIASVVTVVVGNFVYGRFITPAIAALKKAA